MLFKSGLHNLLVLLIADVLQIVGWLVLIFSGEGKTFRSAGWDFSLGGSSGTGTVRSVVNPTQARDWKPEIPSNQAPSRKNADGVKQESSSGTVLYKSSEVFSNKDHENACIDQKQDSFHKDVSVSLSLCLCLLHICAHGIVVCLNLFSVLSISLSNWGDLLLTYSRNRKCEVRSPSVCLCRWDICCAFQNALIKNDWLSMKIV